jgi:hypothetical protein
MQTDIPDMAMANLANLANFDLSKAGFSQFSRFSHSHPQKMTFGGTEDSGLDTVPFGTECDADAKRAWTAQAYARLPARLVSAAIRLCDAYGDDDRRRAEMAEDLIHLAPETWSLMERYLIGKTSELEAEKEVRKPMRRCCDCRHAAIAEGIAACGADVDSGLPVGGFWHDDRHLCSSYQRRLAV